MRIVRVAEPSEFDATLKTLEGERNVFVVMFGSEDPETGQSWCKDCVVADPLIRKTVREVENSVLVECPVGARSDYKNNPDHPYRKHPLAKLTAIPTLFRWTKDGPVVRVVEEECAVVENLLRATQYQP